MDRIDLTVAVRALRSDEMLAPASGESSSEVRRRVTKARRVQERRFRRGKAKLNGFMTTRQIARCCSIDDVGQAVMKDGVERMGLSARAFHRVLKVARSIADLAGAADIAPVHLQEALVYRAAESQR